MSDKILEVKGLCTWISTLDGLLKVADDVSFDVLKGEILAVVGESGCGKSSIMYSILGLLQAEPGIVNGEIYFSMNGRKINLLKGLKEVVSTPEMKEGVIAKDMGKWRKIRAQNLKGVRGGGLSMMLQDSIASLNPRRTIGKQLVDTIRQNQGLGKRDAWKKAEEYLQEVGFEGSFESYPNQLSGGMNQRAALALALSGEPSLLIVDEPTNHQDGETQLKIRELLKKVNKKNISIVIVSHSLSFISNLAHKVMVVGAGKIIEYGKTEDVFRDRVHHPYIAKLIECEKFSSEDVGSKNSLVMEAEGVEKDFLSERKNGRGYAVKDVAFSLERGETLGVVGENGSGKTTLGMCVLKLIEPTKGQCIVRFNGNEDKNLFDLSGENLRKQRRYIQMVFQSPNAAINPRSMRVKEILKEAIEVRCELDGIRSKKSMVEEEISDRLKQVRLGEEKLERYPFELSGGEKRRVTLARALCIEPEFIVTDEITADLDDSTSAQILNLMKALQKEKGLTYLFISHNLWHVTYMSDRIAVMRKGEIVDVLSRQNIQDILDYLLKNKEQKSKVGSYTLDLFSQLSEFDYSGNLP